MYSYWVLKPLVRLRKSLRSRGDQTTTFDVVAERRDRGAEVARGERPHRDLGRALVGEAHAVAEVDRLAALGQHLEVALAQVPPELDVELLGRQGEGSLEDPVDVRPELAAVLEHEVPHAVLAPLRLDVVEDGVAEPVGEEAVNPALGDFGHLVGEDRVAQDHLVAGVLVGGEVGRHALGQPLRRARRVGPDEAAAEEDLELEDVRQLVRDELLELLVREVDREDHAVARREREGAETFRKEPLQGIGLFELRVRRVVDEVDRLRDLEVELARYFVVGAFGVGGDLLEGDLLALVVVDEKVGRPVVLPLERVVDDLVLAEVRVVRVEDLGGGGGGPRQEESDGQGGGGEEFLHSGLSRVSW